VSKRARYNGQYETQVAVDSADINTEFVTVVPGGLLPTETDSGAPVPASVRDDLIANHPDFSEVNQTDPKPEPKTEGAGKAQDKKGD